MNIPAANDIVNLSRVLPIVREMLDYCAAQACLANQANSLAYEDATNEITYHIEVQEFDRSLFDLLNGVDDIWIVTNAGGDS